MSQTAAAQSNPRGSGRRSPLVITLAIVAVLAVLFTFFANIYTDILWFDQLGFVQVLQVRWVSMIVMFLAGFLGMALPLWVSLQVAFRARPVFAQLNSQLDRYQELVEPLRRVAMWVVPVLFGLFAGSAATSRWESAQLWLHAQGFGTSDPEFGIDAGFYVFQLPFYQQLVSFGMAVVFICGLATLAISYLYGAIRVTGREVRISRSARIQLAVIIAIYVALLAVSIWFGQYSTLTSPSVGGSVPTGAGYTEANAAIPGQQILAAIAALVALFFVVTAIIGRWRISIVGTALLVVASVVVGVAYPAIVQNLQVAPSARTLESKYITNNIEATRAAYGVDDMVETDTAVTTDAESGALAADASTTANIRIIDPNQVSDAFANLQSYRQYYGFEQDLDVDRYDIDGQVQDTVIAVRELDLNNIQSADATWYNQHLVYTHGYGVVAAYGNQRGPEGQPVFMQSGIPSTGAIGDYEPRVYFGEQSPDYSIVGAADGSDDVELDYPQSGEEGSGNAYTTFAGDGGPKLDNWFNRLIYALQFQSTEILFSDAVTSDSQILYDRNPVERVQAVAPYLTLDSDPYPAVVDQQLVWIVDGFTTSSQYPYSTQSSMSSAIADSSNPEPAAGANDTVNYIRNSVKAIVNAYDGSVTLYAWDDQDPLLRAWAGIYQNTLQPVSEMSGDLLAHVRYPEDLFKVQREILGKYHVTNASTFYSEEDEWATPSDPTADGENPPAQPPYYLTMGVNGEDPAFTLYSTYIPADGRNVLYGYLSVNADAGSTDGSVADSYGQLTLQMLPKDQSIPGPGQVQNTFDTDNEVSGQLNLLRQGSTEVINGNLLTLPAGGGLLYVQPVYLRSTGGTSFPVLRKVLVAFGDQIAFEDTLDAALDELFGGDSGAAAGDSGTEVNPDGDPEQGANGESGGGSQGSGDGEQATRSELLSQASTLLQERQDAYSNNDLVAAAEADQQLTAVLEQLFELEGSTPTETPTPSPSDAP